MQLIQAQQAYDKVKDRADAGMMPQSVQLQNATIALQTAEAQFRAAQKVGDFGAGFCCAGAGGGAEAQVAQAQAGLDKLQRGPSAEQVAIAQAGVDQAQVALEQAERRLANARLTAPWPGVNGGHRGGRTDPQPAVRLADASKFHLDAQVDEVDISLIQPGQANA